MRAGMTAHPRDYPWSSDHHTALGTTNPMVRPHLLYQRLGMTAARRQAAYRKFFAHDIPQPTVDEIRAATNKSWVLGNDRFRARMEKRLNRPASPKPRGGDRKSDDYRRARMINRV